MAKKKPLPHQNKPPRAIGPKTAAISEADEDIRTTRIEEENGSVADCTTCDDCDGTGVVDSKNCTYCCGLGFTKQYLIFHLPRLGSIP